jgi:hypothetical protein
MWAIQNTALDLKKQTQAYEGSDMASFWKLFSNFYFNMEILRYRETYILYPVAYRALGEHSEKRMENVLADALFSGKTGALTFEQLELIFRLLPLDIAFIGADDRVKFYSDPPHRIFPRSPQVIGRLVQNCHPPKSVATVEEILSSFKEGREDSAEFYLVVRGAFVHIHYYAVRSMDGKYLGIQEVRQMQYTSDPLAGRSGCFRFEIPLDQGSIEIFFNLQYTHLPLGIFRGVGRMCCIDADIGAEFPTDGSSGRFVWVGWAKNGSDLPNCINAFIDQYHAFNQTWFFQVLSLAIAWFDTGHELNNTFELFFTVHVSKAVGQDVLELVSKQYIELTF